MKDDWTHNCLVVSFVGQTTFLALSGEEVEETELDGLAADQQTYHCANIGASRILQVRSREDTFLSLTKSVLPEGDSH